MFLDCRLHPLLSILASKLVESLEDHRSNVVVLLIAFVTLNVLLDPLGSRPFNIKLPQFVW